jgi:hypothetical protein
MLGLPAPYRTPSNTALYLNQSYTLPGGSRLVAGLSIFHNPPLFTKANRVYCNRVSTLVEAWQITSAYNS